MLLNSKPEAILSCLLLRDEAIWLQQRNKAQGEVKDFESALTCLYQNLVIYHLIVLLLVFNLGSLRDLDILDILGLG